MQPRYTHTKKIIRYLSAILLLTIVPSTSLMAQDEAQLTASAPEVVYLNTPFQLVYTVNANAKDLQTPDLKEFEIVAGPFQSRSSYTQIRNGKRTSSTTLTYTYTLVPTQKGTFKIPPTHIKVKQQKIYSNGLNIKVEEEQEEGQGGQPTTSTTKRVNEKSIFIRTIVSKKNIYEQEAILLTYKLYTLLDVTQFTEIKLPDFNGFLKQDIEQSANKQLSYETFDGKNYGAVVIDQALLFPQKTGEINIEPARFTVLLRIKNDHQLQSIFDDFFDSYSNVEKKLIAPAQTIQVKELPTAQKPKNFSGGVGMFTLRSSLSQNSFKTNEAVTLTLKISGIGNLKLLPTPTIEFPTSFETYDPKVTDNYKSTVKGLSGTKTIEYTFIPRHKGKYQIPPLDLVYFDLRTKTYKTLQTPSYQLDVRKGEEQDPNQPLMQGGDFTNQETVKSLNKDIRFIHTEPHTLQTVYQPIIGTARFWIMFLLPLLLALWLLIYIHKKIKENADTVLIKTKRANRVAQRRLKVAKKYLQNGEKTPFYEEIMKALWSYLSDKLSIPVAQLNKDNIQQTMTSHQIDEKIITQFMTILNDCEMAIYAPISVQDTMETTYQKTVKAISEVEDLIKIK